jgi:hypothetical protein
MKFLAGEEWATEGVVAAPSEDYHETSYVLVFEEFQNQRVGCSGYFVIFEGLSVAASLCQAQCLDLMLRKKSF